MQRLDQLDAEKYDEKTFNDNFDFLYFPGYKKTVDNPDALETIYCFLYPNRREVSDEMKTTIRENLELALTNFLEHEKATQTNRF